MGTGKNKKKYTEISMNEVMFGNNVTVYSYDETDSRITIYMKSRAVRDKCPSCGHLSDSYHATYHRSIQTVPIRCKTTYLDVIAYKFNCLNPECSCKVFMEGLPFVSPSQTRTDELTCIILALSLFMSNEGTSSVLAEVGIKVSNDTVGRIYQKIFIEDNPDVEAVGIDDVAIRKGQTYATAIYDMEDHHMIALLDGRDAATLKEWLGNHKKIRLVARDRASAYASAIREILPDCVQVADRFHLLQNLIDRMKDIFKDGLPSDIFVKGGEVLDGVPQKIKVLKVPADSREFDSIHYDNSDPVNENGEVIEYDNKDYNPNRASSKRQAENRKKNRR